MLTVGGTAVVAAWRWGEQSRNIIRVAFNRASEHEVQLFEKGILHDTPFRQLAGQYEALFASCCCGRPKYLKAAQRLRVALRRVVEEGLKLPPFGSPLLFDDDSPRAAHTPISERDEWEMLHLMRHPDFQRNEIIKKLRRDRGWRDYFQTLDAGEGDALIERPPAEAGLAGPAGPPARREGHTETIQDSRRTSLGGFTVAGEGSVAGGVSRSLFSGDGRASLLGSPPGGDGASLHSRGLDSPAQRSRLSGNPTGAPGGGDQPSVGIGGSRRSISGTTSVSASGGNFFSRFRPSPSLAGDSEGGLSRVTENNRSRGDPAPLAETDPATLEHLSRNFRDPIANAGAWIASPTESFGVGPSVAHSVRSASGMELAQQSSLYGRPPSFERSSQDRSSGVPRPSLRRHSGRTSSDRGSARRPQLPRIESASAEAAEGGFSGLGFQQAHLASRDSALANPTSANPTSAGSSATDLPGLARFRRDQSLAGCSGREVQPVLQAAVTLARTGLSQSASSQPALSQPASSQPALSQRAPSLPAPSQPASSQPAPSQPALSQATPFQAAAVQAPPSQPVRSQALLALEQQTSYVPRSLNLAVSTQAEERSTSAQIRMVAASAQETSPPRNRNEAPHGLIEYAVTNATRQREQEARGVRASRASANETPGRGRGNPGRAVPGGASSSEAGRGSGARSGAVAARVQREEDAVRASQQAGSPVLPVSPLTSPSGSVAQSPERRAARPVISTVTSPSRAYRPPGSQTMERR